MLEISVRPSHGWSGDLIVEFAYPSDPPSLYSPGKAPGQVKLVKMDDQVEEGKRHRAIVSLGSQMESSSGMMLRAAAKLARWLETSGAKHVGVAVQKMEALDLEGGMEALCQGLLMGDFRFNRHKSKSEPRPVIQFDLLVEGAGALVERALERSVAVAEGVNLARALAHEPPNVLHPVALGDRVGEIADECGLSCHVVDEEALKEMGAGAILAVGSGSKSPPRLIILEWPGSQPAADPVVLVGKAITFDTGGYTLKTRQGLMRMKFDKAGGADVVGVLQAVAALQLDTHVVGIIAAAENAISQDAYRPNDIVRSLSGKTIEILSTDSEGRMVLADALTYAQRNYKPRVLIDIATLTGGIFVALGRLRAGIMSNHDDLAQALIQSGERTQERLWRMPLDDDYFELIRGDDSDFKNTAGRRASPVVGAIFLKQFVEDGVPWGHLDIAGVSRTDKPGIFGSKGATGFGVRLLIDYLSNLQP